MITSGTRDGDITQLSSKPKLTTGVMNVDPSFSGALANTDTFEIAFWPLTFDRGPYSIHDSFNKVLRTYGLWEKRIVPLSGLVADGDMLSSGDSDWTETNATDAKTVASFPLGYRVLTVTATAADGYVASASIPVEPSASYYLEATGFIASTGAAADIGTLILYDVTNSSETSFTLTESSITGFQPDILSNNVTMLSTTEQVQVWLRSEANTDVIAWTNIIFYRNGETRFVLPDRPQRILRLGQLRVADTAEPEARSWERMYQAAYTPYQQDSGIWTVELREPLSGRAAFIEEYIQPATLSADSDTTYIPTEHLAAFVAEDLLKPLKTDPKWTNRYLKAAYDAVLYRQQYQDVQSNVDRGRRHIVQNYA